MWAGELAWAHPPPFLLPQLVQLLRAQPSAAAVVCTPHWPGSAWYPELQAMASAMATLPAGAFRRVAFDAPATLEAWPAAIFLVEPRRG